MKQLLMFISDEILVNGQSPTLKKMANNFGWASHGAAQFHVNRLIEDGYLKRKGHRLYITKKGRQLLDLC